MRLTSGLYVTVLLSLWLIVSCTGLGPTPPPNTVRTLTPTLPLLPTATQAPEFTFTLSLDKSVYHRGDKILAAMVLKNISTEDVLINSRISVYGQWFLLFNVLDPKGQLAEDVTGFVDEILPSMNDFVTLKPDESFSMTSDLAWSYKINLSGVYSVQAFYRNVFQPSTFDPSDKRVAWMGELPSNVVTFTFEP